MSQASEWISCTASKRKDRWRGEGCTILYDKEGSSSTAMSFPTELVAWTVVELNGSLPVYLFPACFVCSSQLDVHTRMNEGRHGR